MKIPTQIFGMRAAAALYATITDQAIWLEHAARMFDEAADLQAPIRLLDIGCGPGNSTRALGERLGPEDQLCGLDLSLAMLSHAAQYEAPRPPESRIPYVAGDGCGLPFRDESFNLVAGHSFLYLVPDRRQVLAEIRRVLVPGGVLVLLEPNRRGSLGKSALQNLGKWRAVKVQPRDTSFFLLSMVGWRVASKFAGRLDRDEVRALFHEAGFEGVSVDERLGGLGLLCTGRASNSPANSG